MKIGTTYFHVFIDDDYKVEIWTYVLRTIRGRYGYLILKDSFTWGKVSAKTGDYGWLDPIPGWCRKRFTLADGIPDGFGLTKAAALRSELASLRKRFRAAKEWREIDDDDRRQIEAVEKRLKREIGSSKK